MPYIQVDLDAKKKFPMVARGLGVSVAEVALGFLDLWETCFAGKGGSVTPLQLECMFGAPGDRIVAVMGDFGFLEQCQDKTWRVRGADRYRTAQEARSKGGKAASGNLKRGVSSPAPAGSQPGASREPAPAKPRLFIRDPRSDNRESRESIAGGQRTAAAPSPLERPKSDPRLHPLQLQLEATYVTVRGEKYRHRGAADMQALKSLLPISDDTKIEERWRMALSLPSTDWCSCSTFAQLGSKWNDLAGKLNGSSTRLPPDVRRGTVRAEDQRHDLPFDFSGNPIADAGGSK